MKRPWLEFLGLSALRAMLAATADAASRETPAFSECDPAGKTPRRREEKFDGWRCSTWNIGYEKSLAF